LELLSCDALLFEKQLANSDRHDWFALASNTRARNQRVPATDDRFVRSPWLAAAV
jgi:hypothetical protein